MSALDYKVSSLKAWKGRRRKRAAWMGALQDDLHSAFEPFRKLGVKLNIVTLNHLAIDLLKTSEFDAYSENMIDPRSGHSLQLKIDSS